MTVTTTSPLTEIDGRNLYYTFIAGGKRVIASQAELNRINVFPVNDGDTGTNLATTISSVIELLRPDRNYKVTAGRIAEAALMNARGNSGIIFAQFLYGLSLETESSATVNLRQFAESVQRAVRYVYEAVANPVEGTMLTVIKEWAEYLNASWHKFTDFNLFLTSSLAVLRKSLSETTSKLRILATAKVVDAGAKGFVLFVEGIIDYICSRNVKELMQSKTSAPPLFIEELTIAETVNFRYCTEAIIKKCNIDHGKLSELLGSYGDSAVIAGSDELRRIHVHTNDPADLFSELRKHGLLTFQKADDMVRQSDTVHNRKWNIALVVDSTCDISPEILDQYQIHMLPINLYFGDNHYLDKITIKPDQFYTLLDESPDYPKTAQVNEKAFENLYSQLASRYDSVIAINVSDKFSGTFSSSQKAALKVSREFNKPISVINSKGVSGAIGLLALRIAKAIEEGLTHEQIMAMSEKWVSDTKIFVSVRTLKYMVKGGRVSHFKGLVARILNINPIVSVDATGKAIVFDKAFNQRANMEKVMGHIKRLSSGRKLWNYIVLHAQNSDAADWYSAKMEALFDKKPVSVVNISPVIGAHAGVGAASVAFMFE
ncbi:MAG TPA: DegV family protein [Bacteroidales bacterium]|nr:DegV family protein [Bacteroidales bacterium]